MHPDQSNATVEQLAAAALKIAERLRDDPQCERWNIASYEEGSITLDGPPTPVCVVQGPQTSSHGAEVVRLAELAYALAERDRYREALEHINADRLEFAA